jgi:hypothetical protein
VKHGIHECSFTPTEPGLYLIDVFINNIPLPGKFFKSYQFDGKLQKIHTNAKLGIRVRYVSEATLFTTPRLAARRILKSSPEAPTLEIWTF